MCMPLGVKGGEEIGEEKVKKWDNRKNGEFIGIDIPDLPICPHCRAKVQSHPSLLYSWPMHLLAGPQNNGVSGCKMANVATRTGI